jgi:aspartate/methionine/tyrosine aminotransferase
VAKRKKTFRNMPYMGVAQAMVNAAEFGYRNGRPDWCNLGQGQPDVGRIEGAPNRLTWITLEPHDQSYGPPGGIDELREAVAGADRGHIEWELGDVLLALTAGWIEAL